MPSRATAPTPARGPRVLRLPAPLAAGCGLALLFGVLLYAALAHAPFSLLLLALAVAGCGLQLAAPALDDGITMPGLKTAAPQGPLEAQAEGAGLPTGTT